MRKLFLSKKALIPAFIIAALYMVFVTYLMNASLVKDTLIGSYPLSYKWNLLTALLGGMWTAMSGMTLILLIVSAILTGFNLILITKRIGALRSSGKVQFLAGGGSLLGIIGSGCAACGLPVLSLLGFSGGIALLPLQGIELSWLAVILLSLSLYFLVKSYKQDIACALVQKVE